PASDVYSLAVTAYQLLTGKMPFSSNVTELIQQQASCSFRPPSELRIGVASEIDHLLRSALNPNPVKRPQTAQEFATAFTRALEELGQRATQVPPVQPLHIPIRPPPVVPKPPPTQDKNRTKPMSKSIVVIALF